MELVSIPNLDLFDDDKVQISQLDEHDFQVRPDYVFSQTSPISFTIPSLQTLFLNLSSIEVNVLISAKKKPVTETEKANAKDGYVDITDSDNLTLVSMPLSSLFSDVVVKIGSHVVSNKNNLYPYLGFLEKRHLTKPSEYNTLSGEQLVIFDKKDELDQATGDAQALRRKVIESGKTALLKGKINLGIFKTNKWLLPGVDVTLTFYQTSNQFRWVVSGTGLEPMLTIQSIWLSGTRMEINENLLLKLLNGLEKKQAKYPFIRYVASQHSIPNGQRAMVYNLSLPTSETPKAAFIFLVDTDASYGDWSKPAFKSVVSKVESCCISIESRKFPETPLALSTSEGQVEAFSQYKKLVKKLIKEDNNLTLDDFCESYGVIAIDLERNREQMPGRSIDRSGLCQLHIKLTRSISNHSFIVILVYHNHLFVNSGLNTSTDYL